jgi:hypothetical protein
MRVVMPVAGERQDERAWAALVAQAPHAERVDVSGSPTAYYELIASLWAGAEDFAIVEHDVTIAEGTIAALEACPEAWCSCPSAPRSERWANVLARHPDDAPPAEWKPLVEDGYLAGMLQCVRFRRELMLAQPDLVADIRLSRRFWDALDLTFLPAIDASPHLHEELLTEHESATPAEAIARGERVARYRRYHGEPWAGRERNASHKAAR